MAERPFRKREDSGSIPGFGSKLVTTSPATERSAAWKRTGFGSRGSQVRILSFHDAPEGRIPVAGAHTESGPGRPSGL